MKAVGVFRSEEFSPNSVEKDARILRLVGEELKKYAPNTQVSYLTEEELTTTSCEGVDVLFSMGRRESTVACLAKLEQEGVVVVNPAQGIRNSERYALSASFLHVGIPSSETVLLPQIPEEPEGWPFPCWLKRADACAQVKSDVQYLTNRQEACIALKKFRERGIGRAVVNAHLKGDLVKFYGVEGTDFFFWSYPDIHKTKFGLEEQNGTAVGYCFSEQHMKQVCDEAARALSIPVYGGDCVVAEDGTFKIIDFNDWPSFSACGEAAGKAIATYIIHLYERK